VAAGHATLIAAAYAMIELLDHPDGIVIGVRAQPGGRQNAIRGEHGGMLKVSVTQVAEKGKANKSLAEGLAKGLNVKKSQIELIAGQTESHKRFLIRGISRDELAKRIAAALSGQ
jgi:uncharacterized protein